MSRTAVRFSLVALIVATAACDKVALLAPTGSTVTLSISSTSVASNGTAEVIATVIESAGTPVHNGTEVRFQASVGVVDPAVVRTEGGIARTTFRANGASGTAKVTAFSGGARATDIEVLVGGAAASTVTVRTSPTNVTQNGNPVEVIATVRDVSGNPLPGAQVVFTSDNGTLTANSAVTDPNGEARVTLTTSRTTIVRASVAGKEGQATVTLVNNPTVTLSVTPASPNVGVPATFTITPGVTTSGNAISNVTFDPGDGSPTTSLGAITGATTRAHVYTRGGVYQATAVITDVTGLRGQASATVSVDRAVPTVSISGPTQPLSVGQTATFNINSTAAANGPAIRDVVVSFCDGLQQSVGAGSQVVTRSFTFPGTCIVRARVTDQAGTTNESVTSVIIQDRAALEVNVDAAAADAAFSTTCLPTSGYPKTCTISSFGSLNTTVRVQFTATVVNASDPVVRYVWNFGDGSAVETSGRSTDHVFQRGSLFGAATYTVTVTVTTASGATGTGRVTLVIQ